MQRLSIASSPSALALCAVAVVLGADASTAAARHRPGTLVDVALETPELSTLVDAVVKADLVDTLSGDGPFTVFAPTNAAFAAFGIDPETTDVEVLTDVLLDHVLAGRLSADRLARRAGLARTDAAVGGLVLTYGEHPLTVNDLRIVVRDVRASNGVVHVIDGVLLEPGPTVVDKAIANDDLSTLVDAVVRADLADVLAGEGPFTVFAPTNEAFASFGIDPAAVDVETLRAVLLDHVVEGRFTAADLERLAARRGTLETLGGLDLAFRGWPFRVNGLRFETVNVAGTNGVIHVIDGVLLEPSDDGRDRDPRRGALLRRLLRLFRAFFH